MTRKVTATIERTRDGHFGICTDTKDLNYFISGEGVTVELAKQDFMESYKATKEYYKNMGKPMEEIEFDFVQI